MKRITVAVAILVFSLVFSIACDYTQKKFSRELCVLSQKILDDIDGGDDEQLFNDAQQLVQYVEGEKIICLLFIGQSEYSSILALCDRLSLNVQTHKLQNVTDCVRRLIHCDYDV